MALTHTAANPYQKTIVILLAVLVVFMLGWALKITKVVTMPLVFSFFIATLVYPIKQTLENRLPARMRWLGLTTTILVLLLIFALFGGLLWVNIGLITEKSQQYILSFQGYWDHLIAWAVQYNIPLQDNLAQQGNRLVEIFTMGITSVGSSLLIMVLVFFYVVLTLLETDQWRKNLIQAYPQQQAEKFLKSVFALAKKFRQFLWVRTIIGAITGVAVGLWLWIMGVDFAFLWGLLAFLLNYIPNIGSILAVIPPSLLALLQYNTSHALITIGGLTVIQQVVGNYVDPRMQGKVLSVSPLLLLLSLILWGWVWGISGMFLAVPLTVAIVIACLNVPALKPLAMLVSTFPPEAGIPSHPARKTKARRKS